MDQISVLNKPVAHPLGGKRNWLQKFPNALKAARCWISYALTGTHYGVPELVEFALGNHFFEAWQVADELNALGEILAVRHPECAMEIGTARGGTLFILTRLASPHATIVSVDLPEGQFGGGYSAQHQWFYQRFARRGQRLHLLRGDSHSDGMQARVEAAIGGQSLDYLFIDGDHSYPGVKSDFEMYGPMVRKGGLIAFHDIVEGPPETVGGVPQFWREIKSRFCHTEIIKDPNQGGFGIGILHVDE